MLFVRQMLRLGTRFTFTRPLIDLHQTSLISKKKLNVDLHKRYFNCTKRNLCESSQNKKEEVNGKQVLGKLEGKLKLFFTCKHCKFRTGKIISKLAYEKGLVIVRCNGCKKNHLIADNLGWFEEMKNTRNIEKFLALKGESVRKIDNYAEGYTEIVTQEELNLLQQNRDNGLLTEEEQRIIQRKDVGSSDET